MVTSIGSRDWGLIDPFLVSQSARLLTKEGEAEWVLGRGDVCYESQERIEFQNEGVVIHIQNW